MMWLHSLNGYTTSVSRKLITKLKIKIMKSKRVKKAPTVSFTITETNYSDTSNKGVILNKTFIVIARQYDDDNVKTGVVLKDIDSNNKFIVDYVNGEFLLKNQEMKSCTMTDMYGSLCYVTSDWGKKTNVIIKSYKVNKIN